MEGPDLYILKEKLEPFTGKKILDAKGYAKLDHKRIKGKKITGIKTWGKHLLLCMGDLTLRVHFGLFGVYKINNLKKDTNASLALTFTNGTFGAYIAHLRLLEGNLDEMYDWRVDQMSPHFSARAVKELLIAEKEDKQIGDLLLEPKIFSGVGNIIRNESLYRAAIHPESKLGKIPAAKITSLVRHTHSFSKIYYRANKKDRLEKSLKVYDREFCPKGHEVIKKKTGKTKRNSFICEECTRLYR
jgi:endonuclease-8